MFMTKAMKEMLEMEYMKGYRAGEMAQKIQEREDQNRRLEDMLRRGKQLGRAEALAEAGAIDVVTVCEVVDSCEECPRYGDDCDGGIA